VPGIRPEKAAAQSTGGMLHLRVGLGDDALRIEAVQAVGAGWGRHTETAVARILRPAGERLSTTQGGHGCCASEQRDHSIAISGLNQAINDVVALCMTAELQFMQAIARQVGILCAVISMLVPQLEREQSLRVTASPRQGDSKHVRQALTV